MFQGHSSVQFSSSVGFLLISFIVLVSVLEGILNLLCLCKRSFDEGGGLAAIVGASRRGSLALRDTFRVMGCVSSILA